MIIKAPNSILSTRCQTLTRHNYVGIVNKFIKKSWKHRKGAVGIAANQVNMPYRLFIGLNQIKNIWKLFINPRIVIIHGPNKKDEALTKDEECLSIPGKHYKIIRNSGINIMYRDMDFKIRRSYYDGFFANIIQHEIDHLNGILISDKQQ